MSFQSLFEVRQPRIYQVSELTRALKGYIEGQFGSVSVEGEISNFRRNAASGHCYFTLKDEGASLRCALFRRYARYLKFEPQDGMKIRVRGRLSLYEAAGDLSLVAESMEPLGAGELALRFEQLKEKLGKEGLFDSKLKRKLPFLPRCVGLVTSPTGAAVHDFLRILHQRWPNIPVLIAPARVQGVEGAPEICRAIERLGAQEDVDVVVLARGGGSIEDLWSFNEETVVRAIRRCPVPVVSAVGHEVDFTLADFAADVRAPTPTGAAELLVRVKADVKQGLQASVGRLKRAAHRHIEVRRSRMALQGRLLSDPRRVIGERRLELDRLFSRAQRSLDDRLGGTRTRLRSLESRLSRSHPKSRLASQRDQLLRMDQRLQRAMAVDLSEEGRRLSTLAGRLDALSPLKVLSRGYSLAWDEDGRLIRSTEGIKVGDKVQVQVAEGSFNAAVTSLQTSRNS